MCTSDLPKTTRRPPQRFLLDLMQKTLEFARNASVIELWAKVTSHADAILHIPRMRIVFQTTPCARPVQYAYFVFTALATGP